MEISNSSPISVALKSINKEMQKIAEEAGKVAGYALESDSPSTTSLADSFVKIGISENVVKADIAVIQRLQQVEDEVLNIIA